jgi:hypothetical protein
VPALIAGLAPNEKRVLRDAAGRISGALERQGDKLIRWRFIRDSLGRVDRITEADVEPATAAAMNEP